MLTHRPAFDAAWLKQRVVVLEFDNAFRELLVFAGASKADIERLMPTAHSEFSLDWDDLIEERLEADEVWIYETTKAQRKFSGPDEVFFAFNRNSQHSLGQRLPRVMSATTNPQSRPAADAPHSSSR
jgi:hypothetical protein